MSLAKKRRRPSRRRAEPQGEELPDRRPPRPTLVSLSSRQTLADKDFARAQLVLIGCGGLGLCALELLPICRFLPASVVRDVVVIEPRTLPAHYDFLQNYRSITQLRVGLTKANIGRILPAVLGGRTIVLDASVGVDGNKVMKYADRLGCIYLNTSMEYWDLARPNVLAPAGPKLYARTLHSQYRVAVRAFRRAGQPTGVTKVFDHGANPGLISHLAKKGLVDMAAHARGRAPPSRLPTAARAYKDAARALRVHTIHVAELDTQEVRPAFREENAFYNTWSAPGFVAEALDPVQLGFSEANRRWLPESLREVPLHPPPRTGRTPDSEIRPPKAENNNYRNTRYARVRGYDVVCSTKVFAPTGSAPHTTDGFVIPHGESNTLSAYLSTGEYAPNVYYVYHPSAPALRSLSRLRQAAAAGSELRTMPVLDQLSLDTAADGFDSIGAYIQTAGGAGWWCGTVLSIQDVRRFGVRFAGPTECQVAISYLAAARWALRHRRRGLCNPEHLDSDQILRWCLPFLGRFVSRPV